MQVALIPLKDLSRAKARLAAVVGSDDARRELALALFEDVLAAALACSALDGVAVVSRDPDALGIAVEAGAEGLAEPGDLNGALASAATALARRGVDRVVVLAADLPMAQARDIEAVARAQADIAVVPSGDGGTNALALAPGAVPFQFGADSARKHIDGAREAGLGALTLELPRLALDLDTAEDLDRLRAAIEGGEAVGANTLAALERLDLITSIRQG